MAAAIPYALFLKEARRRASQSGLHPARHYLALITGREVAAPKEKATEGFVYFVGAESGPVKIGFATDIPSRLSALQTGSPMRLLVFASLPADPAVERIYHARFAAHRLHGEWFERCPEIEAEIERLNAPTQGDAQ